MASIFFKYVLKNRLPDNILGQESPYYSNEPARTSQDDSRPEKQKTKKVKKPLPPGLTRKDQNILKKVRRRAYRLDESISCWCCSFRFGWSAIIGIIPGIGDVIDMFLAVNIVRTAAQAGLPESVLGHMYANVFVDFVIGLVPFAGDIMDMFYKCNTRNCILLEKALVARGKENLRNVSILESAGADLQDPEFDQKEAKQQKRGWFGLGRSQNENAQGSQEAGHVTTQRQANMQETGVVQR